MKHDNRKALTVAAGVASVGAVMGVLFMYYHRAKRTSSSKIRRGQIITHRGLEPRQGPGFWSESSLEAFQHQIARGFSIEFDPNPTKDGFVVQHDSTLTRITQGADCRAFRELTTQQATSVPLQRGSIPTLAQVLQLIAGSAAASHALHLKGERQTERDLRMLVAELEKWPAALPKLVVFDVRVETARVLHARLPQLLLAASVSHPHDVARYGACTHHTLWTMEQVTAHAELLHGVWLDEWDLSDVDGGHKQLLSRHTFAICRALGLWVGLVTPELHARSPGLLGGEAHPDATGGEDQLFARIARILALGPDALCTDYPEHCWTLANGTAGDQ